MFEITVAKLEDQGAIRRLQTLSPYPETPAQGEPAYFVARSGQALIGAACLEVLADRSALVRLLAVLPGYRKRQVGHQLLLRLVALATEREITEIYAPGLYASDYFGRFGFLPCNFADLPASLQDHPFPGIEKHTGRIMRRSLGPQEMGDHSAVANLARRNFDEGLFCAESVLAAVAEQLDIKSPLIPGIATGFCNGVAGTWGTCGSISGGVLAINMMLGRQKGKESVQKNYDAVRQLIHEFHCRHGSTQCSELIACDLETPEGRKIYRNNGLGRQCKEYVATAATLSLQLIEENAKAGEEPPKGGPLLGC